MTNTRLHKRPEHDTRRLQPHIHRDGSLVDSGTQRALVECASGARPWPVYLFGEAGRGKTCAALALCDITRGSFYVTTITLSDIAYEPEWAEWSRVRDAELLVVDEVGRDNRQRAVDAIERVFDWRQYRPTIWISNHEPSKISEVYDSRVFSRICCGTLIRLTGPDRRFERPPPPEKQQTSEQLDEITAKATQ